MGVTYGPESDGECKGALVPISSLSLSLLITIGSSPRLCPTNKVKLDFSHGTPTKQTRCKSSDELSMHVSY